MPLPLWPTFELLFFLQFHLQMPTFFIQSLSLDDSSHFTWSSSHFHIVHSIHNTLYHHWSCNLVSCETAFFIVVEISTLPSLQAHSFSHFPWLHVLKGDVSLSLSLLIIIVCLRNILLLELFVIIPFSAFFIICLHHCFIGCPWRWEHQNKGLTTESLETTPTFFLFVVCRFISNWKTQVINLWVGRCTFLTLFSHFTIRLSYSSFHITLSFCHF